MLASPVFSTPFGEDSTANIISSSKNKVKWLNPNTPHIHELNIWGGYAFDSFTLWGKTPDATLGQFGLGYNRKLLQLGEQILEYRLELNMYSRYTYPGFDNERNRVSLSGFGIMPLGLRINFRKSRGLQPFLGSSGGFMMLDRPFPDERGEKFNFTFSASGGVEIQLNPKSSVSVGYRYFHLSNGENGQINPGIDSNFFFLSLTIF